MRCLRGLGRAGVLGQSRERFRQSSSASSMKRPAAFRAVARFESASIKTFAASGPRARQDHLCTCANGVMDCNAEKLTVSGGGKRDPGNLKSPPAQQGKPMNASINCSPSRIISSYRSHRGGPFPAKATRRVIHARRCSSAKRARTVTSAFPILQQRGRPFRAHSGPFAWRAGSSTSRTSVTAAGVHIGVHTVFASNKQ